MDSLCNLEIEQAILGTLLSDSHLALWPMVGSLKPEHFSEPLHSRIFEAGAKITAAGAPASPLSLLPYFGKDTTLNEIGGTAYFGRLVAAALPPAHLRSVTGPCGPPICCRGFPRAC
jgi:replicative DNA helicase